MAKWPKLPRGSSNPVRDNKNLPHRYAAMEIMAELELREHDENAQARRKMN